MRWYVLFSFSGREARSIIEAFPKATRRIYTNGSPSSNKVEFDLPVFYLSHFEIMSVLRKEAEKSLVTLHGYNRLLPSEVINNSALDIYNVHPGDVVNHPELVGLHPQRKALNLGLTETGVVIHRVSDDLDMGPVVRRTVVPIQEGETEEGLINRLREAAYPLWISLIKEYIS